MIPRTIHYCWFSGEDKPPLVKVCLASWRKYCAGWKTVEWTVDRIEAEIRKRGMETPSFFRDALAARKWAFASDWARFWIVLQEGGVYLDSDVELIAPIEDLVAAGRYFSCAKDSPREIDPGQGFAAEKGDPVLQAIVEKYETMTFDPACHMVQTCPVIVTEIVSRFSDVRCLPAAVFNPKGNCAGEIRLSPETRGIHHFNASWFNWKQRLAYIWLPTVKKWFRR